MGLALMHIQIVSVKTECKLTKYLNTATLVRGIFVVLIEFTPFDRKSRLVLGIFEKLFYRNLGKMLLVFKANSYC